MADIAKLAAEREAYCTHELATDSGAPPGCSPPLERHGWAVLHDLAILDSAANIDCDDPRRGGHGEV